LILPVFIFHIPQNAIFALIDMAAISRSLEISVMNCIDDRRELWLLLRSTFFSSFHPELFDETSGQI